MTRPRPPRSAPWPRADVDRAIAWSLAVAAGISFLVPVLWALRNRQLRRLEERVNENRAHLSEIERGIRLASSEIEVEAARRIGRHLQVVRYGEEGPAAPCVAGVLILAALASTLAEVAFM